MNIKFTGVRTGTLSGINFQALVDGQSLACSVTFEALHDHFPAGSPDDSFVLGKTLIERAAEAKIRAGVKPVVIYSADL